MDTITFPTHQAVATTAGIPTTSVTGLTATQGRRLLAGVNMAYTIINLSASLPSTSSSGGGSSSGVAASSSTSSGGNCFMGTGIIISYHITSPFHYYYYSPHAMIPFIAVPPCVYFSIFSSLISFLPSLLC